MGANVGVVRFRSRGLLVLWFGCGVVVVWLLLFCGWVSNPHPPLQKQYKILFLWVGFYDRPRPPTKVTQKKTEKNTKAGGLIPDILSTYISIVNADPTSPNQ